jgi:hypothetical protein
MAVQDYAAVCEAHHSTEAVELLMRHRSKTNSRRQEDLEFRFQYMQENPFCEMSRYLIGDVPGVSPADPASDPHHVMGSRKGRHDLRSNLIAVSRKVHIWCHDYPGPDSRIVAIYAKWKKGEMDPEEFHTASGMYLPGWLEIAKPTLQVAAEMLTVLKGAFP